jgi:pyruvate dehydrogenase E1 component alpha subunit
MQGNPILEKLSQLSEMESSKEELMKMHRQMFTMRRIEITCDGEYKARRIRGYLHLYDGQEAIAVGTEAALTPEDDWITSYRCHGVALVRGCSPMQIFSELFGKASGTSRGKGGSMHMYRKQTNFYGGAAIVGAQVPIAAGLAFSHKYAQDKNCSVAFYGDGAANQGQCWEAANMASLWKLPLILVIENNQYGMGTSTQRSSALQEYYKQGGEVIPGIQVNGMDPLAMKAAMLAAKEHATSNGPLFMEAQCYRYHGHSISDPGITYRTKEEVAKIRASRDPIDLVKNHLVQAEMTTEEALKQIEREIRDEVAKAHADAQQANQPDPKELLTDIYTTGKRMTSDKEDEQQPFRMESWIPPVIRMPDKDKSMRRNQKAAE